MRKYDTTYLEVMAQARVEGVVKMYPIECFVQQLKFLWKVLHLKDEALQKIVLHGRLDQNLSIGRTGRKRTYKQCITEALTNFEVTMQQCMDTTKRDWATMIEETGMDAAVHNWEKRARTAKAIDVDWRAAGRQPVKRKAARSAEAVAVAAVEDMDSDGRGREDAESASEGGVDEDEFAHISDSQDADEEGEGHNQKPGGHAMTDIEVDRRQRSASARYNMHKHRQKRQRVGQDIGTIRIDEQEDNHENRAAVWVASTPQLVTTRNRARTRQEFGSEGSEIPDDGQDTSPAPGPVTTTAAKQVDRPSIEGIAFEGTKKRTAKTARRHARRDDKRQRDLCILDGHNNTTYGGEVNLDCIPVHMRAVLGQTSSAGRDKTGKDQQA